MDHRWDETTWQDRAARRERERFATGQIERDPDVERRDQRCFIERVQRVNQSPWAIGAAFYDQRDTYTLNAEIDASGYGCGPSEHPEEGSYAYTRETREQRPGGIAIDASHASSHEEEAWPWLIYKAPEEEPRFAHFHERERPTLWQSLKERAAARLHLATRGDACVDAEIAKDVDRALIVHGDLDTTDIEVVVKGRAVTLRGTVSDHRAKRLAKESAEGVRGVRVVHDRLRIREDDPSDTDVAFAFPLAALGV